MDEHSLHSPFFFDLYTKQFKPAPGGDTYRHIESLRGKLLRDHREIPVRDLGTGGGSESRRKISQIAKNSLTPPRFSCYYDRLVKRFEAKSIVELGTSFGINTLYLAEHRESHVTTFEGAPAVADIAALTFEFAGKKNIDLVTGNIDRTLPTFLQSIRKVDFAFIDANHRYEPTVRYFEWLSKKTHEHSAIVIDDIHYSAEMARAWDDLRAHRLVYASVDLFRCGIAFFDPSLNKQHVILQV